MPETCNPKDCPVSARVEALKEEFNTYRANSSNTHRHREGPGRKTRQALGGPCELHHQRAGRCVPGLAGIRNAGGGETRSVTQLLFVTTQLAALAWVSVSYVIAVYATVRLEQPFPVVELSQQAITTILGVNVLKVVENIFEHNDGPVFGHTKESEDTYV